MALSTADRDRQTDRLVSLSGLSVWSLSGLMRSVMDRAVKGEDWNIDEGTGDPSRMFLSLRTSRSGSVMWSQPGLSLMKLQPRTHLLHFLRRISLSSLHSSLSAGLQLLDWAQGLFWPGPDRYRVTVSPALCWDRVTVSPALSVCWTEPRSMAAPESPSLLSETHPCR